MPSTPAAEPLEQEITLLRGMLQRLARETQDETDPQTLMKVIEACGRAAARLGVLVATQRRLAAMRGQSGGLSEELEATMAELSRLYPARGFEGKRV